MYKMNDKMTNAGNKNCKLREIKFNFTYALDLCSNDFLIYFHSVRQKVQTWSPTWLGRSQATYMFQCIKDTRDFSSKNMMHYFIQKWNV